MGPCVENWKPQCFCVLCFPFFFNLCKTLSVLGFSIKPGNECCLISKKKNNIHHKTTSTATVHRRPRRCHSPPLSNPQEYSEGILWERWMGRRGGIYLPVRMPPSLLTPHGEEGSKGAGPPLTVVYANQREGGGGVVVVPLKWLNVKPLYGAIPASSNPLSSTDC